MSSDELLKMGLMTEDGNIDDVCRTMEGGGDGGV